MKRKWGEPSDAMIRRQYRKALRATKRYEKRVEEFGDTVRAYMVKGNAENHARVNVAAELVEQAQAKARAEVDRHGHLIDLKRRFDT